MQNRVSLKRISTGTTTTWTSWICSVHACTHATIHMLAAALHTERHKMVFQLLQIHSLLKIGQRYTNMKLPDICTQRQRQDLSWLNSIYVVHQSIQMTMEQLVCIQNHAFVFCKLCNNCQRIIISFPSLFNHTAPKAGLLMGTTQNVLD